MPHHVLIVGVGSIGHRHLRCFQLTGRATLAICEVNPQLREQIAMQYGISQTYGSLDEALAERFDAAVITTPAPLHVPMATRLAEAGAHLLIEKPLSTSLAGLDALQQTIARRKLTAAVAYVYRAHPVLGAMRQALQSGRFGAPVQLVAVCGQHFPTYRPAYREIYYKDRATGGGAIQDALTHVINAGEWLVGRVERVTADAAHQVLDGVTVEDTVNLLARQGAALCSYSLNQHQAPNELTLTLVCRQGTVRFEAHQQRWRWAAQPDEPWHDEPGPAMDRDTMFIAQANAFLDALEARARPLCTLEEGIQTLQVNLAALESLAGPTWRDIPLWRPREV